MMNSALKIKMASLNVSNFVKTNFVAEMLCVLLFPIRRLVIAKKVTLVIRFKVVKK